jgi:alpha,alpha-trehalase
VIQYEGGEKMDYMLPNWHSPLPAQTSCSVNCAPASTEYKRFDSSNNKRVYQLAYKASPVIKATHPNSKTSKNPTLFAHPLHPILNYIEKQWINLSVDNSQLLRIIPDDKVNNPSVFLPRLYISDQENPETIKTTLLKSLSPSDLNRIQIVPLPPQEQWKHLLPGLLYVPHPYIVPGGRFKEMYGWDSYFILEGLLRSGHIQLAKDITDNQLYEIQHYGKVLNANRSYYINRSQPPFISEMVLAVYSKTKDKNWLRHASPLIEKQYHYWTSGEHLISQGAAAGLSRYFSYGEGPAIEVEQGEIKDGKNHYQRVQEFFSSHADALDNIGDYYDKQHDRLTPLFYKADGTMRESGFDPSYRFGAFNTDILNYAPVCLNSLLYKMERDLGKIDGILGQPLKQQAYLKRAKQRKAIINRALWDEKHGLFDDYNFAAKQQRYYPFGTMFFPLWAGLATQHQATKTFQNLSLLERKGGLMTSTYQSGNQWDAPFMWAPLQDIAVKGLLNYPQIPESKTAARRISIKFINTVTSKFDAEHTIFEKYDALNSSDTISQKIKYGYSSNEIGFGWTNGVFLELLHTVKTNVASRGH